MGGLPPSGASSRLYLAPQRGVPWALGSMAQGSMALLSIPNGVGPKAQGHPFAGGGEYTLERLRGGRYLPAIP